MKNLKRLLLNSVLWSLLAVLCVLPYAHASLASGQAAFEARRWTEAMDAYLDVLRADPSNTEAHAYVTIIARQMEAARQGIIREQRLELLGNSAKQLEAARKDPTPLTQAILETTQAEKRGQEEGWRTRVEGARTERQSGRLLAASDMLMQVLAENASFIEAQQELSELQSQTRHALDAGAGLSILERYALEGFYAYGQADYAGALVAWNKAQTLAELSYPGTPNGQYAQTLRFSSYEKAAKKHVEEDRRLSELKNLFEQGVGLYRDKHFMRALEQFRKLAIQDPEYPQLGLYLVWSEAASERERTERLGEVKRRQMEHSMQEGLVALEKENFLEARDRFENVLRFDPAHPQAQSYLAMVTAEMQKRHDPKAAQMHYEAGLVAYASGKLDDAAREWQIATRMNPRLEKAQNALSKVRKELAFNRGTDLLDEAVP